MSIEEQQAEPGRSAAGVNALDVRDVSVFYGKMCAVESATLSVAGGECVALIGPNGHGKSSLVNALAGVIDRGGEVVAFGRKLAPRNARAAVKAGIALVPEGRHLYPGLSVRDNIMLGAYAKTRKISANRAWAEVSHVIDTFPALHRLLGQDAGNLSGGEQQMVALARAMASRPRLLLVDEPCLGLSERVSETVYEWMHEVTRTNVSLLVVEENPVQALEISDRMIEIQNGIVGAQPAHPAMATGGAAGR